MSNEPTSRPTSKGPESNPSGTTASSSRTAGSTTGSSTSGQVSREQVADDLRRTISDARRYLEQMGEEGKTRARAKADQAQDQVETCRLRAEDMIREKPLTSVAIALGVGWLIGKLGD